MTIKILVLPVVLWGLLVLGGFGVGPTELLLAVGVFIVGLCVIGHQERRKNSRA